MNNELEWEVITDPEKLFHLKKAGWEIEYGDAPSGWRMWKGIAWRKDWEYHARPPKPKMKQVKLFAYLGSNTLQYMREDSLQQIEGWIRQPHLDLIGEVPE